MFDLGGQVDEDEMAAMVEIVLAALVDDPKQIVLGGFLIGKDLVDLPDDQ